MELKIEWEKRIDKWLRVLSSDICRPIMPIEFEGFTTFEHMPLDAAMKQSRSHIAPGTEWGKEWEYLWTKSSITIPPEADSKHLVLMINTGGEASVFVNGEEYGTRRADWVRDGIQRVSDLTLTENAKAGDTYELAVETYAGHDFPGCNHGPVIPGSYSPRPSDALRTKTGVSSLCVWNEDAYQLYIDVKVIREAVRAMTDDSLRYHDLWRGLREFTTIVDFEQPEQIRTQSYIEARKRLAPLFDAHNGSTAPQFYAFGHAHIDVCWLWPLAETARKIHRTFAAQIRHMDKYPEYKFLQSQPHLYKMTKELYPDLYEKIKEKVKAGQWIPEGGMWVEADTNVASGEALIRQFIHGKRFFMDEFGVDNKMLWLPDVFGYTAALPQIMKGCGIDYFSTQKIWWAYNGGEQFPYNYFTWVGMDGSKIASFMHEDYNSDIHPGFMINRWKGRKQREGVRGFLVPYGYGDGGGGPARDFIEYVRREEDFEGCPKVKNAHPLEFFNEHPAPEDSYVGELYLQCHRGVQTSQSKTKKGNRRCELALRETEFIGTIAKLCGYDYPLEKIDGLWKDVLLCQFHDILPGSSINRVYKEAEELYARVLNELSQIRNDMYSSLLKDDGGVTVFNSLSFERSVMVTLPESFKGAKTADGNTLCVQRLGDRLIAEATVPACGSITIYDCDNQRELPADTAAHASVLGEKATLENSFIKAEFDEYGAISSIIDKQTGDELVSKQGRCNDIRMYKDIPVDYEAWDIDTSYEYCPVELNEKASFELVSAGPLKAAIKITRRINESDMVQTVSLTENSRRVDFDTTVEWRELHKMIKVCFDVDYHSEEALHDIQFGYVKRPNHRSRRYDFDRFEVANHKWTALAEQDRGFAVLNDCKYGVNVLGTSINLTLLRAPFSPDPECDRGTQRFVYSFYAYNGSFKDSGIYKEGYDLNVPAEVVSGSFFSLPAVTVSEDNIILESLKPAEDGSGDYILRFYEAMHTKTRADIKLRLSCSSVCSCNMLETDCKETEFTKTEDGVAIPLEFRPFEIKTLRVKP